MPNAANIVLNDGTADVTFSPDLVTGTHVQYQNLAEGTLAKRGLFHFDRPSSGSDVRRAFRINYPVVVGTDSNGNEIVKQITFKGEMVSPKEASVAQRSKCLALAQDAAGDAGVIAIFSNPEWVW